MKTEEVKAAATAVKSASLRFRLSRVKFSRFRFQGNYYNWSACVRIWARVLSAHFIEQYFRSTNLQRESATGTETLCLLIVPYRLMNITFGDIPVQYLN